MFTGIIEELGIIKRIFRKGNLTVIDIGVSRVYEGVKKGESLSCNGACLTVVRVDKGLLSFEVMPETIKVTNLGSLKIEEKVNLERSLKVGDRVSGHFVLGHIDCLGVIRRKSISSGNTVFDIAVRAEYLKFCLLKGSIAIDGISLTIQRVKSGYFSVYIIPHTFNNTTLSFKGPSDKVNIEFDLLIKSRRNTDYVNF
ncbi:MAG: riboflavin synthase [Candidatus Omnitrophica bacterium]|nr:riboflavin synthase [Candidatus Omnitrophota bacterium]